MPDLEGASLVPGSGWWKKNACTPALAFPVSDPPGSPGGHARRGLVIVGVARSNTAGLEAVESSLISGDGTWPEDVDAACFVSISQGNSGVVAIGSNEAGLANFYAHWNPTLTSSHEQSPNDGLGLLLEPSTTLTTRGPEINQKRALFSRGAVYSSAFAQTDRCTVSSSSSSSTGSAVLDPAGAHGPIGLGGHPDSPAYGSKWAKACGAPVGSRWNGWTLVPSALDAALVDDRDRAYAAMYPDEPPDGVETLTGRYHAASSIDGIPWMMRQDDRTFAEHASEPRFRSLSLTSGGRIFAPDAQHATWAVRPRSITRTSQHIGPLETPANATAPYHTVGRRPVRSAEYGTRIEGRDVVLVSQTFEPPLLTGQPVQRQVETEWPLANAPITTSEQSTAFGHRSTDNLGPVDCWSSTAFQTYANTEGGFELLSVYQLPFPHRGTASAVTPASKAWCPSELRRWANDGENAARSTDSSKQICTAFRYQQADVSSQLLVDQVATVLSGDLVAIVGLLEEVGCSVPTALAEILSGSVECMCDALTLGLASCGCDPAGHVKSFVNEAVASCWLPHVMPSVWDAFPDAEFRWPVNEAAGVKQVALTGLVGAPDRSTTSYLLEAASFVGHAHQGSDWRWGYSDVRGIDPWHWSFARRNGDFASIRGAMELHVARGLWDANAHETGSFELHGKDAWDMLQMGTGQLTNVWPSDAALMAEDDIERSPLEPSGTSSPTSGTWMDMFGRGIFAPHAGSTYGASMEIDGSTTKVGLGLQDWGAFPHRLSMLGQPVVACSDPARRSEIHPPQVMTMDLASVHDLTTDATGIVWGAFGWVNTESPSKIELDLWPPPRPSANAVLVTSGTNAVWHGGSAPECIDNSVGTPDAPADVTLMGCGITIDSSAPQNNYAPTMSCKATPTSNPTHVHCTYEDISNAKNEDADKYGNPRMTPHFARSRFDLRVFVGWKE